MNIDIKGFEEFCRSTEYCSECKLSNIIDCRSAYEKGRHLEQTDKIEEVEEVENEIEVVDINQEIIKKLDAIIKHFNIKL